MPDLGLCGICLQGLRTFLASYENKLKQKSDASLRSMAKPTEPAP